MVANASGDTLGLAPAMTPVKTPRAPPPVCVTLSALERRGAEHPASPRVRSDTGVAGNDAFSLFSKGALHFSDCLSREVL